MANNGDPDQTALCIVCIGHFDKNFGICKFKNEDTSTGSLISFFVFFPLLQTHMIS